MDDVKIDTGIPAPVGQVPKYPWDKMDIGESFFTCVKSNSSLYVSARRRVGKKFRIAPAKVGKQIGFRVWRVE